MNRRLFDLVLVVSAAAVAMTVTLVGTDNRAVQLLFTLPLVLYLPGYALTAALFPGRWPGTAERIAMSLGLSLVLAVLVGLPLALAPWLRRHGLAVVAHITLAQQVYNGVAERVRAALGWRCFDHWVDVYACTSPHVLTQLAARGYPGAKLRVVPSPIDIERFRPRGRAIARRALGWPEDAFIVAYLGTISPLRFPADEVLRALHLALTHIPDLRLAVSAPVDTHPYNVAWAADHLRPVASRSLLPVSVQLRDLDEEQKVAFYNAADVVLLPFRAAVAVEPPLTLLEAMACGAVVAVGPGANHSGIVSNGINGLTFDSPEELALKLRILAGGGASLQHMLGAAARACIVEHNSPATVAQRLATLWETLGACERSNPVPSTLLPHSNAERSTPKSKIVCRSL